MRLLLHGAFVNSKITQRLLPLYVAAFFQGFVLFYTIEKVFMRQIGFDDADIGVMVAIYSAVMLLVETPSGILADRWSRKGVLIMASVALALSALVGGLSHSIPMYLLMASIWGVFFALYTGMYDSIVYDTLLEEKMRIEGNYEHYYGRIKIVDGAALMLGSLIGGVIASEFGLRETYYWTIPLSLMAIGALLVFREPKLHKQHVAVPIVQHVRNTFGAVLKKGQLVFIVGAIVLIQTISYGMIEFSQLWWMTLAMPIIAFGPSNTLLLGTVGLGGWAAGRFGLHRQTAMYITFLVLAVSALGLALSRSTVVIVICQIVLSTGLIGLGVIFNRMMHDSLDSRIRAGASSAVSTLTRVVFIVFALLFGLVSRESGIFAAAWILVALLVVCLLVIARMFAARKLAPAAVSETDMVEVEEYQK